MSSSSKDLKIDIGPSVFFTVESEKTPLPSGEISIKKKGNKLYLRPNSPYRYHQTLEIKEKSSSEDLEEPKNFVRHQHNSTVIINDVAQSYTFVPAHKITHESLCEDDIFDESMIFHDDYKFSMMASTTDPKSFINKSKAVLERNSAILTVSSNSSINSLPKFQECFETKRENPEPNSAITPVTVFCKFCGDNTTTEVTEEKKSL